MTNAFLQSLFVQPPVIIGRRLRPFSAYHAAALMLLDSPFMRGGRQDITREDLVLAVFVCSYGFADGPGTLFPRPSVDDIAGWGRPFDLEEQLAAFRAYLDDYLTLPGLWMPDGGDTKDSGVPAPFYIVATVLRNMAGINEAEAWDMPFARLAAYRACIAEANGWEVVNERQSAILAEIERINAESKEREKQEPVNG